MTSEDFEDPEPMATVSELLYFDLNEAMRLDVLSLHSLLPLNFPDYSSPVPAPSS